MTKKELNLDFELIEHTMRENGLLKSWLATKLDMEPDNFRYQLRKRSPKLITKAQGISTFLRIKLNDLLVSE